MIKLQKKKKNNIYLYQTSVDNMFINDLLPMAPGDYVKVYMFGLMYAENGIEIKQSKLAAILRVPEDEIDKAWRYWEKQGVIEISEIDDEEGKNNYGVKFISQIETFFNAGVNNNYQYKNSGEKRHSGDNGYKDSTNEKRNDENKESKACDLGGMTQAENIINKDMASILKNIYEELEESSGQLLSPKAMDTVAEAISIYEVDPKVFSYAIKYCADRSQYSISYITKVAIEWKKKGLESPSEVKEYNARNDERFSNYKRIFKEIGFNRPVSNADKELMAPWFDRYNFSLKEILDACRKAAGLREPNLRYIDKVLMNKYESQGGKIEHGANGGVKISRKVLEEYLSMLRNKEIDEYNLRCKEVEKRIPIWKDVERIERDIRENIVNFDFTKDGKIKRKQALARQKELDKKKKKILTESGYDENYLEIQYRCKKCNDTGVTNQGKVCSCIEDRTKEAYEWNQKRDKR